MKEFNKHKRYLYYQAEEVNLNCHTLYDSNYIYDVWKRLNCRDK